MLLLWNFGTLHLDKARGVSTVVRAWFENCEGGAAIDCIFGGNGVGVV